MHSVTWNCEARQDSTPHLHLSPPGRRESHPEAIGRFRKAVRPQCVGVRCPERIGNAVLKGEFWNEVIVEAEELRNRLIENPLHAYAAFMYIKGNPDGKKKAQQMQQQIQREWGEPAVPIVEMDPEVDTRCTAPFRLKSDMPSTTMFTTTTSWDGQDCAENYSQCGGKDWKGPTCCQHDWECSRADDFYSGCTAPSSGPLDIEV